MKKIISILLAMLMVFGTFAVLPFTVSAATVSSTALDDKNVKVGDEFDVYINVTNAAEVTMIGFKVPYDAEYLEFVSATDLINDGNTAWQAASNRISYGGIADLATRIANANGKVVKLTYKALKAGTTNLTATVSEMNTGITAAEQYTATGGAITIAEDAPAEPIVYTGNAIQLSGSMVDGTPALNAAGNMEAAVKAGTGSDGTRIYIKTAGAPKTMPYMAIGMKLTNANKTADNFCPMWGSSGNRLWSGGTAGGQNQAFSATEIKKHVADYTVFTGGEAGGWSAVGENDKLIGAAVNAWSGTVGAGTVEVAYVAFFATKAEAEAYTGPDLDAGITPDVLIEAADVEYVNIWGWTGAYNEETGLFTATTEAAISNSSNENGYVQIGLDKTAVGTPAIKYAKIGYKYDKAGLAHETSDNLNVGMTIGGTSGRFWGFNVPQFEAAEGDWLVNLDCTGNGGEHIGGQYANAVATDTYDYLRFTPWKRGSTIPAGTTFSVEYIAFFSDANDAANYVYEGGAGEGEEEESNEPTALVYGKDITFSLNGMYDGADSIAINGNTAVITAGTKNTQDVNWDNDDCALIKATGLTIPATSKYLVFGITTDVNNDSKPSARPSSTQNVKLFVDGTSVGYVDVDLAAHEGTTVYAYAVDASALLTSGTNITLVEFDPIPNSNKGATKGDATRFGAGGSFSVGFIAAFDTLAAAEAYAAEFNGGEEAPETVTVTFKVDGVQYGEPVELEKGEALVYPAVAPTKDGYTFTGWDVAAGTAINADTVVNAIFEEDEEIPTVTPVALYTGEDIEVKGDGYLASLTQTIEDGIIVVTLPEAATGDTTRFSIKTEGAPKSAHYMAYGIMISDYNRTNDNTNAAATVNGGEKETRMWGGASSNQTYSKTEIQKHIVDFSQYTGGQNGSWSAVTDTDKVIGTYIRAWNDGGTVAAGTIVKIQYVAFFNSLEDAQNYVFVAPAPAEKVTVTFKVDGVAYGEPVELEKGAALVYPEVAPTKDGYTFTGWDVAEGSAINADTVVNAIFEEDEVVPVEGIVYYGDDLTVNLGNAAKFPSTYAYDAANAAHTYTSTADGANHDTNRFEISFDGVDANKYQYIAVGLKVTDDTNIVNKSDNFNVNMTIGGTQTRMWGGKITIPSAEIGKVVAYAKTCSGGDKGLNWTQVTADDVINGVTINPWGQSPAKVIPTGTVVAIQYVALFETEADANAFVFDVEEAAKVEVTYMLDGQVIATQKYTPGEALVYPEVEAPKGYEITGWNVDEGTIVEDAMTVQAFFNEVELPLVEDDVLGKDLDITWGSYYKSANCNGKIEVVGNDTVATGSSNWQNDGCADFTIKNVPVDGKYLILNIEASSDAAKLATEDNITIGSLILDADFTAGSQFVFDISSLGDINTISTINVRAFKAQGGQLENVNVVVGSVSTAPYAITLDGELVAVADEGALYELPVAVSDEAGMRFVGWTDGTDMYLAGTKIEMNADLVLTPEFEAATEWYVTYIVNGEVYEVVTVALDGEVAHPTAPAMTGYKFAGWYNEAGERVINGDAVTNDMTLTANFTEAGDDEEFLGTFLTILKMITAKKQAGGSTAGGSQAGTTTGTTASSTPVVVYTGEQITVKPQGTIASAEAAVNAAGNVEVALPAGTGGDGTRIYIVTEGADMTTPFMAVGLKLTNATKAKDVFCPMVNGSKRFWSPSDADANGNNQTFSATAIVNHVVDFTGFKGGEVSGGWSGVTSSDVLTGVSVNAWTYDQAFAAGTMEIAYVAFFKTLDDAKAYVHGAVAEEAPAEEPKEEVKEEEPVVSAGAILGKDLEIEWASYWTHAGNNPVIAAVGNNTVATGDSNWQNDGCSIFTIKNVKIEKGAKTLVLNIKASSNYDHTPARPSTSNNIVITVGGNSKTYSFDFTNATEELTAIELDISNFKNVTKLDSIQLDVFANNKVETAVGNLQGVEVIIGAIECK